MEVLLGLLFLAYLGGWFLSFLGLFLSNANGKKKFAMAHGYAILLLIFFSNYQESQELSEIMMFLSVFNFLAMTFFLVFHYYQLENEKEKLGKLQKIITDTIITDKQ